MWGYHIEYPHFWQKPILPKPPTQKKQRKEPPLAKARGVPEKPLLRVSSIAKRCGDTLLDCSYHYLFPAFDYKQEVRERRTAAQDFFILIEKRNGWKKAKEQVSFAKASFSSFFTTRKGLGRAKHHWVLPQLPPPLLFQWFLFRCRLFP